MELAEEEKEEDEQSAMEHVENYSTSDVAASKNIQIKLFLMIKIHALLFVLFFFDVALKAALSGGRSKFYLDVIRAGVIWA